MTKNNPRLLDENENFIQKNKPFMRKDSWLTSKDLFSSFKYAVQGFIYNLLTQRNFKIHLFIGICVCIISLWLNLSFNDLAIIVLTIGLVLILELINTSIVTVVDLAIGREFNSLARIAKDSAAAAVLVASICSILIGSFLILPPLNL